MTQSQFRIAIVGPCGAGKTTLAEQLRDLGFNARQIAQEHSFVPAMWKLISQPDFLIYLDVSYKQSTTRKQFHWTSKEHAEQIRRLKHARQHCDLLIDTSHLTPDEVLREVLKQLDVGQQS